MIACRSNPKTQNCRPNRLTLLLRVKRLRVKRNMRIKSSRPAEKLHAERQIPAALAVALQGFHLGTHFFCIGSAA
jgi:hypothetical protein